MHDILCGDALAVLHGMADACVDAVVTDPPYALAFMGARWDTGLLAHDRAFWAEVLRVAKPGAFLLAFGGTRTYHRLACAIEDAGWELRDMLNWLYGSGFPKSKSCLKPAHEPILLAKAPGPLQPLQIDACRVAHDRDGGRGKWGNYGQNPANHTTEPGSNGTTLGAGWHHPGSTRHDAGRWAPNLLLSHHPDCQPAGVRRVRGSNVPGPAGRGPGYHRGSVTKQPATHYADAEGYESVDAWICVDGCPIKALDAQAGPRTSGGYPPEGGQRSHQATYGTSNERGAQRFTSSTGSASRFFPTFAPEPEDATSARSLPINNGGVPFIYVPKASSRERSAGLPDGQRSPHPTVKPVALMRWLVRLVTPPGGLVLDPFAGTASTGVACVYEGSSFVGVEAQTAYVEIARRRLAHALEQQAGPLFAGLADRE